MTFDAHRAETAANMGGNDDSISLGNAIHGAADLFDDTERFMADDCALNAPHPTLVEMQVRAADGTRGNAQQDIGGFTHLRIANVSYHDAPCFFEDDRFHKLVPSLR